MQPPFSADCMTVEQMLAGPLRLSVPAYQRPYAWTTQQAGQLLDDILLAIDDTGGTEERSERDAPDDADSDYFLGAVVLMVGRDAPQSSQRSGATHEIVDGLQRLVTLTILLAVLRDIAEDDDPMTAARAGSCLVDANGPDRPEEPRFRLKLVGPTQGFFQSFVQQRRATSAMPDSDDLPAPETRLLAVREHLMASLIGESAERRRQLVDYLLGRCHFAVIAARTLDRAHHIFAVLNDRGLPLARGDILKAQILGAVSADRHADLHARWLDVEQRLGGSLEELFSHLRTIEGRSRARIIDEIKSLVERSGDAAAFVDGTVFPYAAILQSIRSARHDKADPADPVRTRLGYLGWLGSHDWIPPLMLYWRMIDGDPARLDAFLVRLDRLAYGMRILGIGSDKRTVRYRALLDAVRSGRIDQPSSPLDLTRDEQRLVAYNMRTLHARSQLACKLILLRLNDLVAGAPQNLDPSAFTVEHVLPQKPARTSRWRDWFPNAEERERSTQSLGNLILVSRVDNEQARNSELDRKLEIYFGKGIEQPALTREIEGLTEWRPQDVRRREERLAALLNQHWQIATGRSIADTGIFEATAAPVILADTPSRPPHRPPASLAPDRVTTTRASDHTTPLGQD